MARADVAARQLLDEGGWTSPPVEPQYVAEALGVVVVEAPMSWDMSGMLIREPNRIVIGVNKDHHPTRQRFTIAHEIGHLRLHKGRSMIMDSDVRVNFRDEESSLATDREEIEANRFAAALLMPEHMVRSWIATESFESSKELVERLAKSLKVSKQAVNFRLVNLGFFPTPVELD